MTVLGIAFITLSLGCVVYIIMWEWVNRRVSTPPRRDRTHRNRYCREHYDWCQVEDDRDYV